MSKDKGLATTRRDTALSPRTRATFLEDFFSNPWGFFQTPMINDAFRMDIREDDKSYTVEAEMPGFKKDDIQMDLDDGVLTISAAARNKVDEDGKKLLRSERSYSYMERSVYLPDAADDGVRAKLDNGELVITVQKQPAGSRKRKIDIE